MANEKVDGRLDSLAEFVRSKSFEIGITAIILFNAVLLGLETSPAVAQRFGGEIQALNNLILGIFVVEMILRMFAFGDKFWRDGWSWFDMIVIGIALLPATVGFGALRAVRAVRLLRLITVVPSLRRVVEGLIRALPGLGWIVFLLLLLIYVFSVMATQLFGKTHPEFFGTLGASAFSLFQIMTLEGWPDIARAVMEQHPWAWLFFLVFILVSSFSVLNLFIGVIVEAMQAQAQQRAEQIEAVVENEHDAVMAELRKVREELREVRTAMDNRRAR